MSFVSFAYEKSLTFHGGLKKEIWYNSYYSLKSVIEYYNFKMIFINDISVRSVDTVLAHRT